MDKRIKYKLFAFRKRFIFNACTRSAECVGFIGGGTLQTKGKDACIRDSLVARCCGLLAILHNADL